MDRLLPVFAVIVFLIGAGVFLGGFLLQEAPAPSPILPATPAVPVDAAAVAPRKAAPELASAPANNPEPVLELEASITGRVHDAKTKAGIAGGRFRATGILNTPGNFESAETGVDGVYRIEGLGPGAYEVSLANDVRGYPREYEVRVDTRTARVRIGPGEQREGVDFALEPGVGISGIVRDRSGTPIEGVEIHVDGTPSKDYSGADGIFLAAIPFPWPRVTVRARKEGFATAFVRDLEVTEEGVRGLVFVLGPESTISGVVVDTEDKPVSHGVVGLSATDGRKFYTQAPTDAQGAFKITGVEAGAYRILPMRSMREYQRDNTTDPLERSVGVGEHVTGLRIVLQDPEGLTISGTVSDPLGSPIAKALVEAGIPGAGDSIRTESGPEGTFTIRGLAEETYRIAVFHKDYSSAGVPDVPAGKKDLQIYLEEPGAIEGVVLDATTRKPVTHYQIAVTPSVLSLASFKSVASPEGTFLFDKVQPGSTLLCVRADGYQETTFAVSELAAGETFDGLEILLQPGGTVAGIVTDGNGTPIANAQIHEGVSMPNDIDGPAAHLATTDDAGRFQVHGLPASTAVIAAYHPDYTPTIVRVNTSVHNELQIVLGNGGTVEGTVLVGGEPAAAHIWIYPTGTEQGYSTQSGTWDGTYRAEELPAGKVQVSARLMSDSRELTQEAEVYEGQTTRVDFNISVGTGTLSGIVSRNGEPVSNVMLRLLHATREGEVFLATTDSRGVYVLDELPAGRYAGTAREGYEGPSRRVEVTLYAGQSINHDIDFTGGVRVNCHVIGAVGRVRGPSLMLTESSNVRRPRTVAELEALRRSAVAFAHGTGAGFPDVPPGTYTLVGCDNNYSLEYLTDAEGMIERMNFATTPIVVGNTGPVEVELRFSD